MVSDMPKKSTGDNNEQLSVRLPPQAIKLVEDLVPIGLHGGSRGEVARTLILSRLAQLVSEGILRLK